jgi:hypothetical protein
VCRSPWGEKWSGSRALFNTRLKALFYYHGARTHLSLEKDAPEPRPVEHLDDGRIVQTPMVGGLHHRYTRQAA